MSSTKIIEFNNVEYYTFYYKKNKGQVHQSKFKYFSWDTLFLPNKIYIIRNSQEQINSFWQLRGIEFQKDFHISGLRLYKSLDNSKILYGDYLHRKENLKSLLWIEWSYSSLTVLLFKFWYPEDNDLRKEYLEKIYNLVLNQRKGHD